MKRLLLATILSIPAVGWGWAWAQPVSPLGLSGNESWSCGTGGPGGPSVFCTSALLRGAPGYQIISAQPAGNTVTATTLANRYIFAFALTAAVTLNTPPAPLDGQMIVVANGTGAAFTFAITLTASGTQTVQGGAVAALGANTSAEWQYSLATTTWYRIR